MTSYNAQGSHAFEEIQGYLRFFEQDIKKSRLILLGDVIVITIIIHIQDINNFSHFSLLQIITVATFLNHTGFPSPANETASPNETALSLKRVAHRLLKYDYYSSQQLAELGLK